MIERGSADAKEITTSVREMPSLKTPMGRCRAWLRLALMQKKLSDYWNVLVDGAILQVGDLAVVVVGAILQVGFSCCCYGRCHSTGGI